MGEISSSIFMEKFSHSRNQTSSALSKKICNGNGFSDRSAYDDVFGGPPKFGVPTISPRVEDYTEIFGSFHASRASSIPVLDLPAVDEADVFFDVQDVDYSDIFGGFGGLDFAVSYEELLGRSKDGDDSSEEAWYVDLLHARGFCLRLFSVRSVAEKTAEKEKQNLNILLYLFIYYIWVFET